MSPRNEKREEATKGGPAADAKAERLATALRANLKRRKGQARERAEQEGNAPDGIAKTR